MNVLEKKWGIFLWMNVLWILGTIVLGYIAATSEPPTGSTKAIETAKMIFLSLGGLGVIIPAYLSAISAFEQNETRRNENTFHLLERWDDPLLFEAREYTRELKAKKPNLSDTDLIAEINGNKNLHQSIVLVMNYFDRVRISIESGRVDNKILKDVQGPMFEDIYQRLLPFIKSLGTEYEKDWTKTHDLLR